MLFGLFACSVGSSVESQVAAGKEALAKSDAKSAVVSFKAALQQDPQVVETRLLLGQALLAAGDPESATLELTKALDAKADPNLVVPLLARAMLLNGDFKKLVTLYENAQLSDKQAFASLKTTLAAGWGALSDKPRAEAALTAALAAAPEFGPALILKARLQAGQRDLEGALATVKRVLDADPSAHEAWHLLGELKAYFEKDAEGAEKAFHKALSLDPSYVSSHMSLISSRLSAQDIEGAKAQAAKLRAVLPKHPQVMFIDAQIAYASNDVARARELVQQMMRFASNHVGVLQLSGAIEGQSGALVLAESRFAKALQIEPNLLLARRHLAQVYLRLGQHQRALEVVQPMLAPELNYAEAHAIAGEAYLRLGNAQAAEAAFGQAAKIEPNNERIQTAIALTNLSKGDPATAFSQLEVLSSKSKESFADSALVSARLRRREYAAALEAVGNMERKNPGSAAAAEIRGTIYLEQRDYPAARKAFEDALKLDPALFSAIANLATIDSIEGKSAEARARFEGAIRDDKNNHYARMALADLLLRTGAPLEEVKAQLNEAIKSSPNESGPRLQLIDLTLKKRQYKDALSVAQEAAAALPSDLAVLDAVGRAQMESGDVEQAIGTFRRIAAVDQTSALPYVRLAVVYKVSGMRAAAETALRKALDVQPDLSQAQELLIELLVEGKRSRDALELARGIQRQRPKETTGYAFEALIHTRLKAPDAAISTLRKGLAVSGVNPELARLLYLALLKENRTPEADRFATDWMKAHPEDTSFDYQLAVTAITRSDLAQAETRLRRVVSRRPNHPLALNNLAWVLAFQKKTGGTEYAQRAVNLMPDRSSLIDTLAMTLAVDKEFEKALELQKRAVAMSPDDKGLRLNLAKIALQAGDKTLAKAELDALKAVGPTLPYFKEVNRLLETL